MENTNYRRREFSNPEGSPEIKGFDLTTIRWILLTPYLNTLNML